MAGRLRRTTAVSFYGYSHARNWFRRSSTLPGRKCNDPIYYQLHLAFTNLIFSHQSADGVANGLQTKESYDVAGAEVELLKLQASLVRAQSTGSKVESENVEKVERSVSVNVPEYTTSPSTENKTSGSPEWLLRVKLASKTETLELGVETREDALEWRKAIT